jgi:hypothetical protein
VHKAPAAADAGVEGGKENHRLAPVSSLSYKDLQKELRERGLGAGGKKEMLALRLQAARDQEEQTKAVGAASKPPPATVESPIAPAEEFEDHPQAPSSPSGLSPALFRDRGSAGRSPLAAALKVGFGREFEG